MNATKTGHSRIHTHTERGGGAGKEDGEEEEEEEGSKRIDDELYERGEIGGPNRTAAAGLCNLYSFSPAQSRPSHTVRWLTRSAIISKRNAPGVRPLLFRHSRSRFLLFFFCFRRSAPVCPRVDALVVDTMVSFD